MSKQEVIELKPIEIATAKVSIEGTSDLVLNKMADPMAKALTEERKDKAKSISKPDPWEIIMTSLHWIDGKPTDFSEEGMKEALKNNRVGISTFGMMKSLGAAVVRNEIDTYATKFNACMNILEPLIPITFTEHFIDEKLMQPKKGAPVLARLNRFTGWGANFTIQYIVGGAYSIDMIVNIINLAGFGLGIGSGRSSGYGRYKVVNVQ